MANPVLLDASALLAWLQGEPGGEIVETALLTQDCTLSAANLAEVISRSLDRRISDADLQRILDDLPVRILPLTAEDGAGAGWLRKLTRSQGLSLGDRLCLALAQRTNATVLTTDRPWLELATPLGLQIQCIRPDQH